MRITNRMIINKYLRSVNNLATDLNRQNTKVFSGRSFSKSSENTPAAIKAYKIRTDLSKLEGYQYNADHANATLTNTESSLMHMEELMQTAKEKIVQGLNGTQSVEERKIIATELRNLQEEFYQTLNANVSDTYYFGGSNTDVRPFEIVSGKLQYVQNETTSFDLDSLTAAETSAFEADSRYIDIGLNVKFDISGEIDKSTVFSYTIQGVSVVGSGTTDIDGTPYSNNLYNLLGEIADSFDTDTYDSDKTELLSGHFSDRLSTITQAITEVGAKSSYLEFTQNRFTNNEYNLEDAQSKVEDSDIAESIIQYKTQQVAYNAALAMGTRLIQQSIFDFMS